MRMKNRVMKEGETAKELNYEGEDMQAAVLRKQAYISLTMFLHREM
ncbi:hypothetical protein ACP059_04190 [Bacillus cabrialesii]